MPSAQALPAQQANKVAAARDFSFRDFMMLPFVWILRNARGKL